jgi:hypothetical protein
MDQRKEKGPLLPEIVHIWERRAETSAEFADDWRDYAMMLSAFHAALERAPRTDEACESLDIERLFVEEIERIAAIVNAIFPQGGLMELAFYMPGAKDREVRTRENDLTV